ncbi:hypothetical protein Baya_11015 [Bagarius yarrelli]|uniref:Uncharacterized protein n=1 Tax=Bagarius yarrelli TaxID=175774 RepID=A0A556UYQ6_BAGYA|nr:hypothetical protein Baya_11015 [Bagarius yarrelli]
MLAPLRYFSFYTPSKERCQATDGRIETVKEREKCEEERQQEQRDTIQNRKRSTAALDDYTDRKAAINRVVALQAGGVLQNIEMSFSFTGRDCDVCQLMLELDESVFFFESTYEPNCVTQAVDEGKPAVCCWGWFDVYGFGNPLIFSPADSLSAVGGHRVLSRIRLVENLVDVITLPLRQI